MATRTSRLRVIGQMLLGLALALAVFEAGLQLIERTPLWRVLPVIEPILGNPDKDVGYAFAPGVEGTWVREHRSKIRINSLGMRERELPAVKPAGEVRVGLTGDSMVEALQVDAADTFARLAEAKLGERGYKTVIANMAMSGNGPLRQLARLEKLGPSLALDQVVMYSSAADFISGELLVDSENPGYVVHDGRMARGYGFRNRWQVRNVDSASGRAFLWLLRTSSLVRMLYLRTKDPLPEMMGLPKIPGTAGVNDPCRTDLLERLERLWHHGMPQDQYRAAQMFLTELAANAAARNVPVTYLMADIPIPAAECRQVRHLRETLVARIAAEFSSRGIRFVDWESEVADHLQKMYGPGIPTSRLRGFGRLVGGGHLNHVGHRVFGAALVAILADGDSITNTGQAGRTTSASGQ